MPFFGVMIDCSRNAVMTVEQLKHFVSLLRSFGYDSVQLYTEDTYEIKGEPYFGYMRGRYSTEELKEIDAFCISIGMELVPCIQTLAHLNQIFRWKKYAEIHDLTDILLADDEKTYRLIENMFVSLSENFTSRKVMIGMDEAHLVGLGKHLDRFGFENRFNLLFRHLRRVTDIAERYGFSVMMWGDMFIRMQNHGFYCHNIEGREVLMDSAIADMMPENVTPVYWDYYNTKKEIYADLIDKHRMLNPHVVFAGGAWTWEGFAPYNGYSVKTMLPAMQVCREKNVNEIVITLWGDDGKDCSYYSVLPALLRIRCAYDGILDEQEVKDRFRFLVGAEYDDFMSLDLLNQTDNHGEVIRNPSKYMLYNDLFSGQFDTTVKGGETKLYQSLVEKYRAAAKRAGEYAYLFSFYEALSEVLQIKYELGVALRTAYQSGDRVALTLCLHRMEALQLRVKTLCNAFRKVWLKENKPYGLEVQEQRFGGLLMRIACCTERLAEYLEHKTDTIEELEEVLLDVEGKGKEFTQKTTDYNQWSTMISASVV